MSWNYRVMRHRGAGEEWFAIHEVYYGEDGSLQSYTRDPVDVGSDEGVEGVKRVLGLMLLACDKLVLTDEDFRG